MADKVIENLEQLKHCITKPCDITCSYYNAEDMICPCSYDVSSDVVIDNAIQTIRELQNQIPKWHLVKTMPLTDEEKEYYSDYQDGDIEFMYDCKMPNDNQEVLVATRYGTDKTTYYTDCGCYFENYEDEDEVIAWIEMPKFESEV